MTDDEIVVEFRKILYDSIFEEGMTDNEVNEILDMALSADNITNDDIISSVRIGESNGMTADKQIEIGKKLISKLKL